MTPRTLFILILRVLGILSLKELLVAIPQLISAVLSFFAYSLEDGLWMIVVSLLSVAVIMWIAYVLIFKAEMLVGKLGLDKGFAEEVLQLNISFRAVLRIAVVVVAGIILITEIPNLCNLIYRFTLREGRSMFSGENDWSPLIITIVKIIIALLLIGERNRILDLLHPSPAPENKTKE